MKEAYSKEDAKMTQGFAILCMCVLHLFCRTGEDVYGTPLVWITKEKPLVYYFGFFAEICVPIYSICAGYARQFNCADSYKRNLRRLFRLLKNYWIVLVIFSVIGLLTGGTIPGSFEKFIKSVFLLYSYNGAWWYLNTYVLLLLLPTVVILFPVKKIGTVSGLVSCLILQVMWYLVGKFGLLPWVVQENHLIFFNKEINNLIGVLPYYWAGAFLCRGNVLETCKKSLQKIEKRYKNVILFLLWLVIFVEFTALNKSVLVGIVGLSTFLIFNLIDKGEKCKKVFLFLGDHSTNIWLTHMFFYLTDPFSGLVQKARYPITMLIFMLLLCIGTSYVVKYIDVLLKKAKCILCKENVSTI